MRNCVVVCGMLLSLFSCDGTDPVIDQEPRRPATTTEVSTGLVSLEQPRLVNFQVGDVRMTMWVEFDPELVEVLSPYEPQFDSERGVIVLNDDRVLPVSNVESSDLPNIDHSQWILDSESFRSLETGELMSSGEQDFEFSGGTLTLSVRSEGFMQVGASTPSVGILEYLTDGTVLRGLEEPPELQFRADESSVFTGKSDRLFDSFQSALDDVERPLVGIGNVHGLAFDYGAALTESEYSEFLRGVRSDDKIPWDYIGNGCQSRALVVAKQLADRGVYSVALFASGYLATWFTGTRIDWSFHAATGVPVDDGNGGITFGVLDSAFGPESVLTLDEWINLFVTDRGYSKTVVLDVMPYYQAELPSHQGIARADLFERSYDLAYADLVVLKKWLEENNEF